MNKKEILDILKSDILSKTAISDEGQNLLNVTTNLQKATASDIVFYNVNNDEKSWATFYKRLETGKPGLLILNKEATNYKSDNAIFVEATDFLKLQKALMDKLFPNNGKLKIVGVTGTNGKTTTVNLAMQISTMLGHPAFSVGTIGVQDSKGSIYDDLESTTPSYVEVRKLINKFQDKYEVCFIEVSSHSLVQKRLNDLMLSGAAWTSFSQDHLDYHKTMEEYFEAKLLIEKNYLSDGAHLIVPHFEQDLFKRIKTVHPTGRLKEAKTLEERGIHEKPLFYHSTYNQSNVEIALQLNADLFGEDKVKNIDLKNIVTPLGRFSLIEIESTKLAIVDYAHTPDALLNIGSAIKKAFPEHSLTVVFGCGGNRDKTKRPLMGKAVMSFADKIVVTSDNPRDEAPEDIIMDIINGLAGSYEAMVDREKAILYALETMAEHEIVLIAGKGHEEYQEIKGIKHPFSDFNIVSNFKRG
jgi:UDP-N-acetylmuramoyl-L-alanyl-D-glutamate--2,6-diaminopimelate ligase